MKILSRLGYFFISLLVLQSISLTVICFLQYAILDHVSAPQPSFSVTDSIWRAVIPLPAELPADDNVLLVFVVWGSLLVALALVVMYTSSVGSKILKFAIQHWSGKLTYGNLFATKFIVVGVSYTLIMLVSLLLPAFEPINPLNTWLVIAAYICISGQLYLARRTKTPIKRVL